VSTAIEVESVDRVIGYQQDFGPQYRSSCPLHNPCVSAASLIGVPAAQNLARTPSARTRSPAGEFRINDLDRWVQATAEKECRRRMVYYGERKDYGLQCA
jgi:hypothetical protein